jgi:hypothetical protein
MALGDYKFVAQSPLLPGLSAAKWKTTFSVSSLRA